MYIHILRHDGGAIAEQVFGSIAQAHGHRVEIVDPRLPLFRFGRPEVVFARCELDSFLDPLFGDYLSALKVYEREGIPLVNGTSFLIHGQDKFLSHLAVERSLLRFPLGECFSPLTVRVRDRRSLCHQAQTFLDRFGGVVIKLPCSGRGLGVWFARSTDEIETILDCHQGLEAVLLQQPIEKESHQGGCLRDMRLEVVRHFQTNRPFISRAYYRVGGEGAFLTNVSRGGSIESIDIISPQVEMFIARILDAVHGDVAGVDIARDRQGRYWFEEVNIAFETKQVTLDLLGDRIWHDVLALCLQRGAASQLQHSHKTCKMGLHEK